MLPVAFLTVSLLACAFGSPIANQYFDNLLNGALPNEIRFLNMDPANVTNFTTQFEDKVKFIGKVKGQAEFFRGNLTGLSRVRRHFECQGPYYSYGTKNYNCTIGLDHLSINYDGKMKYGKMPKVDIKGKSNVTETLVFVEVGQNLPMQQPTVKNFQFQQVGTLQVKFTGLGPLNRFTKFLEDGYKAHVSAEIFNSMGQKFQYALGRAVGQVPFPP